MSSLVARFGTAALCMAVAGFAVWRSVPVLGFALAERQTGGSMDKAAFEPFAATLETGGLAAAAIQSGMQSEMAEVSPADRMKAAAHLLARKPLSGAAWLDLATARLDAGQGMDAVTAALRLSALTGPNESALMASRSLFALPLWAALADDLHRRVAQDIAGGWDRFEATDKLVMRLTLSEAPAIRARLAALLRQMDGVNQVWFDDLGLGPFASPQPEGATP